MRHGCEGKNERRKLPSTFVDSRRLSQVLWRIAFGSRKAFPRKLSRKARRKSLSRAAAPLSLLRLRVSDCTGSASLHITLNIIIILRYRYEKDNIAFIHSDL